MREEENEKAEIKEGRREREKEKSIQHIDNTDPGNFFEWLCYNLPLCIIKSFLWS